MKKNILAIVLSTACLVLLSAGAHAEISAFKSESAARKHCPDDEIVWGFNKSGGVFHVKGTKGYGTTKDGAYFCRGEAEKGGWHAARNNQ
jgi:hypothetical protein